MKSFIKKLIHPRYVQTLANLKKHLFGGFSRKTYSDSGEDILVSEKIFPSKAEGFYVDVGAFHPFLSSNTRILYKRGWHGINIDPNPESIKAFQRFRPRDINLRLGVSPQRETRTYYRFSHAGVNTFSREAMEEKRKKSWNTFLGEEQIESAPLRDILDEYLPKNQPIDLLDIDVEGLDYEVLTSNNWEKYVPRAVIVEDKTFDPSEPTESRTYTFLIGKGYSLSAFVGQTLLFVR